MQTVPFTTIIEDAVRRAELTDLSAVETDLIANRCRLLKLWCTIFHDIDGALDVDFDAGALSSPSQAPAQRAAHAQWFNAQYRLRLVERRANESFGRFLQRYYSGSPPDHDEFEQTVSASPLAPERAEQFRRLLRTDSQALYSQRS